MHVQNRSNLHLGAALLVIGLVVSGCASPRKTVEVYGSFDNFAEVPDATGIVFYLFELQHDRNPLVLASFVPAVKLVPDAHGKFEFRGKLCLPTYSSTGIADTGTFKEDILDDVHVLEFHIAFPDPSQVPTQLAERKGEIERLDRLLEVRRALAQKVGGDEKISCMMRGLLVR